MRKLFSFCAAMLVALAANAAVVSIAPDSPQSGDNIRREIRDHINSGDTLLLAGGTYTEMDQIALNKSVVILAAEGARPVIKHQYYATLTGENTKVIIKGVTFDGSLYPSNDHCIRPYDEKAGKSLTLENCEFTGYPNYIIYPQRGNRCLDELIIKNCYFHDNVRSAVWAGYDAGESTNLSLLSLDIQNSIFSNFTDVKEALISIKNDGTETANQKVKIDHCTFYNFVKNNDGSYTFVDVRKATDVAISNCIFAQPTADMSGATYCYGGSINNCLTFNTTGHRSGACTVTNPVDGDPKFADAAHGDFYLMAGSPALAAGEGGSNIGACPAAEMKTFYCKMDKAWWTDADAAVGIYTWDDNGYQRAAWPGERMTPVAGKENVWSFDVNIARNHMGMFTRVNGSSDVSYWGAKTANLTFPTDVRNWYTITNETNCWDGDGCICGGEWSKDGEGPRFYVAGSMTDWATNKIPVYGADSYTLENLAAGSYMVKVVDGDDWLGLSSLTDTAAGLYPEREDAICFDLAAQGDVTINYKKGGDYTLTGDFAAPVAKLIGINGWTEATDAILMTPAADRKSASATLNLTGDWYDFKIILGGYWFGRENEGADNYKIWRDFAWVDNLKALDPIKSVSLQTDGQGDYTFVLNYAKRRLDVTFPEKGGGLGVDNIEAAGKAVKMMENGQLVIIKNGVKYNVVGSQIQ